MRTRGSAAALMLLAALAGPPSPAHAGMLPKGTFELAPALRFSRQQYS